MIGDAPRGHWIAGRWIADEATRSRGGRWSSVVGVLVLIGLLDVVLAMLPASAEMPANTSGQLRAVIQAAADAPERSLLILADRRLDVTELRARVDIDAAITVHAIDVPMLTPADALALVRELDRVDPDASVELALTIDLRDFADAHAESDCSGPPTCALSIEGPRASLSIARDWLIDHTPLLRHRARLGLDPSPPNSSEREPELARELPSIEHAQVRALDSLLTRLQLQGRRTTLILPPSRDVDESSRGRLHADLAALIHDLGDPRITLVDLDHPLFLAEHFDPDGQPTREGRELLAINMLFELGVPLDRRPFEWQMVRPEGHDRTLVHRVDLGFAEAGATTTRFAEPDGVATSSDGEWIVIADTGNHMLRQLRGNHQTVERLAGDPDHAGIVDGPARTHARLIAPRRPELDGERLLFIDGHAAEHLRVVEHDRVDTLTWTGPRCRDMRSLRIHRGAVLVLCGDGSLLRVDPTQATSERLSAPAARPHVALEVDDERIWLADIDARIWEQRFHPDGTLALAQLVFANRARQPDGDASDLLPYGHRVGYPYHFNDIALAKVVDMRWVDRYEALLVMDEHPVDASVQPAPTERVHLRLLDFEVQAVFPWIKPQAHGEAFTLWNEQAKLNSSWYHVGSMAMVERDASLVWLERDRSRLIHIADGLLGLARTANHHTRGVTIPHQTTISGDAARRANVLRPDRFVDRRVEPLPREGPYVLLLVGSSLSSMSDRFGNYSLARRIERELQRELGYRDRIRLDVYAVSSPAATLADNLKVLDNWLHASVPPDVVMIEAHDFGGGWLSDSKQVAEMFGKLEALARRYDSLVVFYDNSQTEANRRDGLRSTDLDVVTVLNQARALGFTVVRPGDLLLERLTTDSPWGNQPFGNNQHHGATWAIDRNAELVAALVYPVVRRFLHGRTPARLHERDPLAFEAESLGEPLRTALTGVAIDRERLPKVATSHLQREYEAGLLSVHVDLAGYPNLARNDKELERLAIAVALTVLDDDIHAELARELEIEIVEFANYDEYGDGVLDSAQSSWKRRLDRDGLQTLLTERAPKLRER